MPKMWCAMGNCAYGYRELPHFGLLENHTGRFFMSVRLCCVQQNGEATLPPRSVYAHSA